MRLAILGSRGIPGNYGGFETFAEELSVRLVQEGVDVTVFCEGNEDTNDTYMGVVRATRTAPELGFGTRLWFDLKCLWEARRQYDVVYMLGYGAAIFCFIPRVWGTQVWINMDGIEWARRKWKWYAKLWLQVMEGIAIRTASQVIADADAISRFLEKRHGRLRACSVVPYGTIAVETQPSVRGLQRWDVEAGKYYLIVGRIEPENHIVEMIRGFLASTSAYPLLIIGNVYEETQYAKLARTLQSERIRFLGPLYDKASVTGLRYYASAYLHGHSVGGTNPSLVEALGAGSVIIAHENEFNREVAGDIGYYFSSEEDIPAIIARVEGLNVERRTNLRQESIERARRYYSWRVVQQKYLYLLEEAIQKK